MNRLAQKTYLAQTQQQHRGGRFYSAGFTITEILVVIAIIGALATISFMSYNGVQQRTRDKSLLADVDRLDGIETQYGIETGTEAKVWNSASGLDSSLNFTPSPGNVLDVSTNGTGYCIRAYNPQAATYKSLATAIKKESQPGSCNIILPPVDVYIASTQSFTVPAGVTSVTLQVWGGRGSHCSYDMGGTGGIGGYAKGTLAVMADDVLNVTVGGDGPIIPSSCSSNKSDGGATWINRPVASALLIGVGGEGADNCDCEMDPRQGITYPGLTNISTGSAGPTHAVITYVPPPLP